MLISLLIILPITFCGFVLTYLYEKEDSLLVRACAGNIVGSVLFGSFSFLIACFFGLSITTISLSLLCMLLSFTLLAKRNIRQNVQADFGKARVNLENIASGKILSPAYYIGLFLLLYFFFKRGMIETDDGIFTGSSHNYGDLSFHLGAIFSFTEGNNFPPENPSFADAKFTYPFIVDFLAACLIKFGARVSDTLLVQNVTLGFSLFVLFEKFSALITRSRAVGKLSAFIFLFGGGLGFLIFFCDCTQDGRIFSDFLWNLPTDYTIRQAGLRWGNPLTTLFITQRSLLLGMPLTLIALTWLWNVFTAKNIVVGKREIGASVFIGVLAGTLPLIHVHSLMVLFVVTAFLCIFRFDKWREWMGFAVGVMLVATPELLWMTTGSATRLREFIGWHFGWGAGDENLLLFWLRNAGLFIPLLFLGIFLSFKRENQDLPERSIKSGIQDSQFKIVLFYLPFALIFIVAHLVKLAPFEWDNIKVLIYWYVGSVPIVGWLLVFLWKKHSIFKIFISLCLITLTLSGVIDVWRVVSKQININFFDHDAVAIAEQIKQKTSPKALFLNAPTYNSAVVLSGRRSFMRFSAHLASYGIDYLPREKELSEIYQGTAQAEMLLKKNNIEYVIVSPAENELNVNKEFFKKYPKIAEVGRYSVYEIKDK